MIHSEASEYANKTVTVNAPGLRHHLGDDSAIHEFLVEDWWDRLGGGSWMHAKGNYAALNYAMRSGMFKLPIDNEVLYGKDNTGLGHIIHVSEIQKDES